MADTVNLNTATSLEGQVVEALRELKQAEDEWIAEGLTLDPPVDRENRVTVSANFTASTISFDVTIPVEFADSANGYIITAAPYLP
ncbi:hypothetical protein [Leptolyngbya sp. KIOST-1]|uniref:hypothetical protein n=1 Tax=Leptolyngbya sp. KIOST-1 TaxID=1229172 RepID=UPI0005664C9F|nr:hypothetical protein [Leptolyngbya sp. KIOST-1]